MLIRDFVGIDPDSRQLVCAHLSGAGQKAVYKTFHATEDGLAVFIDWLKRLKDPVVAVEGANGQSGPIEKALRKAKLDFYSFQPKDVESERKTSLGLGKDNEKDAHAAALLAIGLHEKGLLGRWKRTFSVDTELQGLTRFDEKARRKMNGEVSDLWKLIREISPDLYLFLSGHLGGVDQKNNILDSSGILQLLSKHPDPSEWTALGRDGIWEAMGKKNIRGREKLIGLLLDMSKRVLKTGAAYRYMVGEVAENVWRLKGQRSKLEKLIGETAENRPAVMHLYSQLREKNGLSGISIAACAKVAAEIVDVRRFAREDSLAQYAGFGMTLSETGPKKAGKLPRMVRTAHFNHRLKNAVMQMARSVIHWNPNHRLYGVFMEYQKRGMSYLEALKRVGRALIRMIFRAMKAGVVLSENTKFEDKAVAPESTVPDVEAAVEPVEIKGTRVAKMGKTRRNKSASNTSDPSDNIVPQKTKVRQQK